MKEIHVIKSTHIYWGNYLIVYLKNDFMILCSWWVVLFPTFAIAVKTPGDVISAEPKNLMVVLLTTGKKTWTQTQNYIFSTKDTFPSRIPRIPGALTACSRFISQVSSAFHTCATQ